MRLPGAAGCISASALAHAVEDRLRRRVFEAPGQADVAIEGHVERSDSAWHALVSVTDLAGTVVGTRELSSADPSCHDLDAPLALAIALLVDPTATASIPPEVQPRESPAAATSSATPPPHPPSAGRARKAPDRASPDQPWRSFMNVGAGLAVGALPDASPGLVLRIGVVPPRAWPIVLSGALWTESLASVGGANSIGFSLAYAGLGVCPIVARWRGAGLSACAGLDAGAMSTRGLADGAILVRRRFVIAAAGRIEGSLDLGSRWFFGIGGGPSVPLVRDSFVYERGDATHLVFRMASVAAAFDAGLGFRSP